jgi:hypothetical protein
MASLCLSADLGTTFVRGWLEGTKVGRTEALQPRLIAWAAVVELEPQLRVRRGKYLNGWTSRRSSA